MNKLRILLADDHDIVRRGARSLIEAQENWEVCGEAADGRQAVALAVQLKPEIVVLDVGMPELNGVEATRQIKRFLPKTAVLALTGYDSNAILQQLTEAGALGRVLKNEASQHLVPAIRMLARRQPFTCSRAAQIAFGDSRRSGDPALPGLSVRERELVQLLAEGKSNKRTAVILGISVRTVETHRNTVMRKLHLESVASLVRYAIRNQIIEV